MQIVYKKNTIKKVRPPRTTDNPNPIPRPVWSEFDNTPVKLRKAYGIFDVPAVAPKSKVAVITSFLVPVGQINADVAVWCNEFGIPPVTVTVVSNQGAFRFSPEWYSETIMDVKAVIAMNPNVDIYVVCQKNSGTGFTRGAIESAVSLGVNIITMSFGNYEVTGRFNYLESYLNANPDLICCASAGNFRTLAYPSTSDYVFSVGATELSVNSKTNRTTEKATGWSSCGPTVGTPIPEYQRNIPLLNSFNAKTKFGPDFSINGTFFPIYNSSVVNKKIKGWESVGGTSLSCPLFAGILSLVDQYRRNNGLPGLKRQDIVTLQNQPNVQDYFIDTQYGFSNRDRVNVNDPNDVPKYVSLPGYDVPTCFGAPLLCKWIEFFGHNSNPPPPNDSSSPAIRNAGANINTIVSAHTPSQNAPAPKKNHNVLAPKTLNLPPSVVAPNVVTPQKLRNMYNIPTVTAAGNSAPTKIGIVSSGFNINIQNELNAWCDGFGLPRKTIFVQNLGLSNPNQVQFRQWSMELSQTVQSVYTVNPNADIVVVCAADLRTDNMIRAIDRICQLGCKLVKLNFGTGLPESFVFDNTFKKYSDVLFVSGCGNTQLTYPSTSEYALSVGGTRVVFNSDSTKNSEVAMAQQGLGPTRLPVKKPMYQTKINILKDVLTKSCPELCAVGSPQSGFPVYNSASTSSSPWSVQSGTSLSASVVSGLISLVNQSKQNAAILSNADLNIKVSDLKLFDLHTLFNENNVSEYFTDITSGTVQDTRFKINYSAGNGFDVPTGFGVPNVSKWIEYFSGTKFFTPQQLIDAYSIPSVPVFNNRSKVGIVAMAFNPSIQDELNVYCNRMGMQPRTVKSVNLGAVFDPSNTREGTETSMNVQTIFAVNQNVDIVVVTSKDRNNESIIGAIDRACREGCHIVKLNFSLPPNTNTTLNNLYRGLDRLFERYNDVIFMSGVGDSVLDYPASSSLVLSVGKTRLSLNASTNARVSEYSVSPQACGEATSFSPKPDYQKNIPALASFKNKACPEMCALGDDMSGVLIYNDVQKWVVSSGTSLSASIAAGLFSLVNQVRLNNKALPLTLGQLYDLFNSSDFVPAQYFYDVQQGSALDSRFSILYGNQIGFDVAGGFGVPNINKFIEYFVGLGCPVIKRNVIV